MDDQPMIELLYWRECPSWDRALAMLREEIEAAGLDLGVVRAREVTSEEAAGEEEFVGSPTIRIDGADMQPPGPDEPVGLNCRVYRHRDGRISPLPDRADLRDALRAATQRGVKSR